MTTALKIAKEALVSELKAKRPEMVAYDRDQLRAHREPCKETAALRRAFFRDLIKLPDAELAEMGRYDRSMPDGTACPMSKVEQLDRALEWLDRDYRKTFTVDANDTYGQLLRWTATPTSQTVCG